MTSVWRSKCKILPCFSLGLKSNFHIKQTKLLLSQLHKKTPHKPQKMLPTHWLNPREHTQNVTVLCYAYVHLRAPFASSKYKRRM